MKLTESHLEQLMKIAISAAMEAGAEIAKYKNRNVEVQNKVGGDSYASQVVTEVDLLSQDIVLKHLTPSLDQFELGLLTEESEDNGGRLVNDYFWCVDPIDGTLPFIEKVHGYSVSIGLISKSGEPIIGVIYDPHEDNLYYARKGSQLYKNNRLWEPLRDNGDEHHLTWIMDRSLTDDPHYALLLSRLESLANDNNQKLRIIRQGGGALNACWVFENKPACYLKVPKKTDGGGSLWDYAASACVFEISGAHVSDIYGGKLDLNRKDSTFMNHRGILYSSDDALAQDIINIYQEIRLDK